MLGASRTFHLACARTNFIAALRCSPGRFFAANELKALLAYLVLNYDMKLGGDGKRPASIFYGTNVIPSPTGQVLFRKRQVA